MRGLMDVNSNMLREPLMIQVSWVKICINSCVCIVDNGFLNLANVGLVINDILCNSFAAKRATTLVASRENGTIICN